MAILNILLSGQALASIAGVISLAIVVRALTRLGGESADLRVRLLRIEQDLSRLREHLPEKRKVVESARKVVFPLKQQSTRMQSYYDRLCMIESKALKAEEQEKQEEEEEIQIRRSGLQGP